MQTILYLHGFASSPEGRKVALLRERLRAPGYRVAAPDLNRPSFRKLDFDEMVSIAVTSARTEKPGVVVGSSLGALVALEASRRGIEVPLVLVAPALGFGSRWIEKLAHGDPIPFFHHGAGREIPIHRQFFESMAALEADREPPGQRVVVVMGEKDESVPFAGVERIWRGWEASGRLAPGSRFIPIPDGDHGLIGSVDLIADVVGGLLV